MKHLSIATTLLAVALLVGCGPNNGGQKVYESDRPAPPVPSQPIPVPPPQLPDVKPNFVSLQTAGDMMLVDLGTLNDQERQNTRYMVACNEYNAGDKNMDKYIGATNKFVNSISTETRLSPVVPIGIAQCIFRIDLRDYGITPAEWTQLENLLLIDFIDESIRGQQIRFLTGTNKPYVFVSDAAITSLNADALTQNGLYYELIEQPFELVDFFTSLGVNEQQEFDDEEATLAAFSRSQIALGKTRMVQALESDDGYVITSFDSDLNDQDNHFENPFPITAANAQGVQRSQNVFAVNAQEHIYHLKNGMLGFRLNGAAGTLELEAPNSVVLNYDASGQSLDPTIYIGSCYACHSGTPMIPFTDQLGAHIENSGFDALEKDLGRVFFNATKMDARLQETNRIYRDALDLVGAPETSDSIHQNLIYNLRREQTADQVAGLLMMPEDVFLNRLRGSQISSQIFGNLLNRGGSVGLADLNANFGQLVLDVGAYKDDEL